MVASIQETADTYHISTAFIGVILLPIVVRRLVPAQAGNVAHILVNPTGKCSRTRYFRMDGAEKQDGTIDRDLCGELNREHILTFFFS